MDADTLVGTIIIEVCIADAIAASCIDDATGELEALSMDTAIEFNEARP